MSAETIFYIIVGIVVFNYLFDNLLDLLNLLNWHNELPPEAEGIYDYEKYRKSQRYNKENLRFGFITKTFSFVLVLLMLYKQGFAYVHNIAEGISDNKIIIGLIFFAIIAIASDILSLPFNLYKIFVIEEKYGFNKTTLKTFIADKIKGLLLGAIIGGILLYVISWLYYSFGASFWIYAWITISAFSLLATMFYASVIVPLFNKLTPLPQGELRSAIEAYAQKVNFKLDNIFIMDGSKRSAKANAFFSGLGARKRIVLYDTLIEKHPTDELVGVLAHEIGHYKKKHTLTAVFASILQTGLMLFIFSLVSNNSELPEALGVDEPFFHISILAFTLLYAPLSEILGIGLNILSRKNEFEADRYAAETFSSPPLQSALKKLSADSLSNLTPHPAYVFVHYSHPPLLKRLAALKRIN